MSGPSNYSAHDVAGAAALAELLRIRDGRYNFDWAVSACRRGFTLLVEKLGSEWIHGNFGEPLAGYLQSTGHVSAPRRAPPRRDKNPLWDSGMPAAYVALALPLNEDPNHAGWHVIQALLLAGAALHAREKIPLEDVEKIAVFLTGTFDSTQPRTREPRVEYLTRLGADFDLERLIKLTETANGLPSGFKGALNRLIHAIKEAPIRSSPKAIGRSGAGRPSLFRKPIHHPTEPDDEGSRQVLIGTSLPLDAEARQHAIDEAEPLGELAASELAETAEFSEDTTYHQRAAIARRSFFDLRQRLWARYQWEALTPGEMAIAAKRWLDFAETAAKEEHRLHVEAGLLACLVGCTGWAEDQLWSTPIVRSAEEIPEGHRRAIIWESGSLVFPVPGTDPRYEPAARGLSSVMLHVRDRVILRLPERVARLAREVARRADSSEPIWLFNDNELEPLLDVIRGEQRNVRVAEPRETLARMRNGHRLELLNRSQDLALAQLTCGDLLGATEVSLAYFACAQSRVQNLYDSVCEAHGYGSTGVSLDPALVGGSKVQISSEDAQAIAKSQSIGLLQAARNRNLTTPEKLRLHARYVPAVTWQLCAATAIRPGNYLGRLTIRDFSLRSRCAVLADKIVDEGHLGRLLPLCDLLVETLQAYGQHLSALTLDQQVSASLRSAARSALEGTGPIFFLVKNGKCEPLGVEDLGVYAPGKWPFPRNVYRHRLASKLRESGCPGLYVEAFLGHVELGLQPLGRESFMDPSKFVEVTAQFVQAQMLADGWKVLRGLSSSDASSWELRSLGPWILDLIPVHLATVETLREQRRVELERFETEHATVIAASVSMAIAKVVPDFELKRGGKLLLADVTSIRKALTASATCLADMQARISALRARLSEAREERGWGVARLPSFFRGPVEASPFGREFPSAYEGVLRLRQFFVDTLNGKQKTVRSFTARARCVLALILWHGVCDWSRLENILRNVHRGRRTEGLGDAITIPYDIGDEAPLSTAEVLRGPVALAVVHFVNEGLPVSGTKAEIGSEIGRCLPWWLVKASPGGQLLDWLLETIKIAHVFESAPPLRDVWAGACSSVTISASRIDRLFSKRSGSAGDLLPEVEGATTADYAGSSAPQARGFKKTWGYLYAHYRTLRDILRLRKGSAKWLPYAKRSLPAGAADGAIRREILSELQQHLGIVPAQSIPWLLTSYAIDLLTNGTPSHTDVRTRTPYGYVVGAGGILMRVHADSMLIELEVEDALQVYQDVVDAAKKGYRPFLGKYLSYFHNYLVRQHDAASIDLRSIGGALIGLPDVGLITPCEFEAAQSYLRQPGPGIGSTTAQLQAIDVMHLGYATGARSGEIVLRELRELVAEIPRTGLYIRRTKWADTKTRMSTRVISLEGWIPSGLVESIRTSALDMHGGQLANAPLFPDADQPHQPVRPDLIAAYLRDAFRAATGEIDAHQYWLRHSATSLEFLYLFADEFLLRQIAATATTSIPFPVAASSSDFAQLLGGHTALSQVHAAAFRVRRGHRSLMTSLVNYVHILGLIEPLACRLAFDRIQSQGIATLMGRTAVWARQILSRAKVARTDHAGIRSALIAASMRADQAGITSAESPATSIPKRTSGIALGEIVRLVTRYFHHGDIEEAVRKLNATPAAKAFAANQLRTLPFILAAGKKAAVSAPENSPSLLAVVDAARRNIQLSIGPNMIDEQLIRSAFGRMRQQGKLAIPADARVWGLVLAQTDVNEKVLRVRSAEELNYLIGALESVVGKFPNGDHLAFVVDVKVSDVTELTLDSKLREIPLIKRPLRRMDGHLPLGISLVSQEGHRRMSTLLLLSVIWKIWREASGLQRP